MKAKIVYIALALVLVFSLAAVAVSAVSVSANGPVDSVDIGTIASETGHNLQGWGPIEPDTHGGNWGDLAGGGSPIYNSSDNKCRATWFYNEAVSDNWATLTVNTSSGMTATELKLLVLDGGSNDSFRVYVDDNLVKDYIANPGHEDWVLHSIDLSSYSLTGTLTVNITATAPAGPYWNPYGQLGVDRVELYAETTPAAPPAASACFIATAAYGTEAAAEIDVLRSFRDEVLLESTVGSQLVELYYQTSPPVADFISENSLLRTIVRELVIDPLVSVASFTQGIWGK